METRYVKLCELSRMIGLPKATLKRLATQRRIPALKLRQGFRFNPIAVRDALDREANEGVSDTREVSHA